MRNLKRALSLALASVMLLGMMVVGAGAASFPDVDDSNNVEAIEVLGAVKVFVGDENGNLNPDENISRNQMAVILAKLLKGSDADSYTVGSFPFTDVPEWAQKYVACCYDNGIVAGRGDGIYDGDSTVNGQEAAAMVLRTLGYEKLEGTGVNWAQPVVAKANSIGLFDGVVSSATAPLIRDQVAQLALNALQSDVVVTSSGSNIDLGDIGSITTDVKYEKVEVKSTDPQYDGEDDEVQQLCEKLYKNDLKLNTSDVDDFGRPASTWRYKNTDVVTVTNAVEASFDGKTSEANVLKALKGLEYNGKKISTNADVTAIANMTANGKLVEVFAEDNEITDIVQITYTLAKVASVTTNSDGDVRYSLTAEGSGTGSASGTVYADPDKDDTIVVNGSVGKDDIVTYVKANDVVYVYPTTSFVGAQDSYKTSARAGTIVVDGSTYNVGTGVNGVALNDTYFPNSEDDANFYVDQFGYVVMSDAIESDTEYAILDGIIYKDAEGLRGKPYAAANLVLADGTLVADAKVVEINGLDLEEDGGYTEAIDDDAVKITNATADTFTALALSKTVADNSVFEGVIVSYSEDKGDYTLTMENVESKSDAAPTFTYKGTVAATNEVTVKGDPSVVYNGTNTSVAATGSTIFVVKTDDDEYSVYTGFRNVPTIKDDSDVIPVTVVRDDDGKAELVYIDASASTATVGDESGDILYLVSSNAQVTGKDKDRVYTAIVNGEKTTVKVKSGTTAVNTAFASGENKLFELSYDSDNYVTKATAITTAGKWHAGETLLDDVNTKDGIIAGYTYDGSETVIAIEDDDVIDGATVEDAVKSDVIWVKTKDTSGADAKAIDTIYIVKDGEKTLPDGAGVGAIQDALDTGDKKVTSAEETIDGDLTIGDGAKLTLTASATLSTGKTITVEAGGTLVLEDVLTTTGSAKIELDGGDVELSETASATLPTITGDGNVELQGDNSQAVDEVAAAIGNTLQSASVSGATEERPRVITLENDGVKLTGEGKLTSWYDKALDDIIEDNDAACVRVFYVELTGVTADQTKVYGEVYKNGEWKAMDGVLGTAGGYTVQSSDMSGNYMPVELLLTDLTTQVRFTVITTNE